MFLRHARAARLAAACVLFTVALGMAPKADNPETRFDEANTPTHEMVVQNVASSRETPQPGMETARRVPAQSRRISVRMSLREYAGRSTDSGSLRELLCSFRC